MAKNEVMNYNELKSLDVYEFFLLLVNFEKNARNRPDNKDGKPSERR